MEATLEINGTTPNDGAAPTGAGTESETEAQPTRKRRPARVIDLASPPLFLNREEAALVANISLRTIADLISKRELRTVRLGARRIVRRIDLESFLERKAV